VTRATQEPVPLPELSPDAQAFIVMLLTEVNQLWDDWAAWQAKLSVGLPKDADRQHVEGILAQAGTVLDDFQQLTSPGSEIDPIEFMDRVIAARKKLTMLGLVKRAPGRNHNRHGYTHHD
jgi:hypothetical protein